LLFINVLAAIRLPLRHQRAKSREASSHRGFSMKPIVTLLIISLITACSVHDRSSSLVSVGDSATDRFERRAESLGALLGARNFIRGALDSGLKDSDKSTWLYLADLYFKTFEFEGQHYLIADAPSVRVKLYQDALADLEKQISPTAVGFPYAGYFYFRALFLFRIFQDSNEYVRLGMLSALNKAFSEGIDTAGAGSTLYAAGGLYRIKALWKSFPGVRGFPGGIWNPEESLKLIDTAIASAGYPGSLSGDIFCENFRAKAFILRQNANYKKMLYFSAQASIIFSEYLKEELLPSEEVEEAKDCVKSLIGDITGEGVVFKPIIVPSGSIEYRYDAQAFYTSVDKSSGNVTLDGVCGSETDPRSESFTLIKSLSKPYDPERAGRIETLEFSIGRSESPCQNLMVFFSGNGLSFKTSNLDVKFSDYGIPDTTFVESTNSELSSRSESLFNHSATMSSLVLARPNLFCDIRSAEIAKIDAGLIRKFKNDYQLLFNANYDTDKAANLFTCPAKTTFASEMANCEANPTMSTPFCDSFTLYVMDLRWVADQLKQTRIRLARLNSEASKIRTELEDLEKALNAEVELSESTYGDLLD
jgi:hypothetical protein